MTNLMERAWVRVAGILAIALIMNVLTSSGVFAQAVSQISGTVKDQSGAVLPGVEITATQTDTGIARNTVSNETGSYVLPNPAVGPLRRNPPRRRAASRATRTISTAIISRPIPMRRRPMRPRTCMPACWRRRSA